MKLEEIILLAKEETKLTRMQRVIVSELTDGAKTTTQISRVLYNDDNESAKRAVWVHICHLRKRDVKIVKRSGTYVLTGGEGDAQ